MAHLVMGRRCAFVIAKMFRWPKANGDHWPNTHAAKHDYLWPGVALLALLALVAVELRWQGRVWWCSCGQGDLWWGDIHSGHCSQHFLDPYSFTHILHGLVFYGALVWLLPRLAFPWRLWLVLALEALWEVIENTEFVIERYRTATAAFGYEGDSIANSLGDILSCAVGVLLARFLGLRRSIVLFVLIELVLLVWIRDNLTLSVVMLVCPLEAIKSWQAMGG
jgi:uncharacterized protein DUF2585